MENKIEAIIFDMDGVLVNTERPRFELIQKLLKEKGIVLADELYKKIIGKRTNLFLEEEFGDKLTEEEIEEIRQERKRIFREDPTKYVSAEPFANQCVEKLFRAGYVLAVASNAQEKIIDICLEEIGVKNFFVTIVGSDEIANSKPHPDIYLKCLEKLGISSGKCIAIEDSPMGIKAAKAAGLKCVAVTYTHAKTELNEADFIVDSLESIDATFIKSNF